MASGLHGENGLNPETSIHLLQIYVLPVMVYGLKVVLPKPALVDKLNRTYKKNLKQILSSNYCHRSRRVHTLGCPVHGRYYT